jgi:hypothetical protein
MGVQLHDPLPDDLQRHPADPGRLGPRRAIVDRRQCQQTASLCRILRPAGRKAQLLRLKIIP